MKLQTGPSFVNPWLSFAVTFQNIVVLVSAIPKSADVFEILLANNVVGLFVVPYLTSYFKVSFMSGSEQLHCKVIPNAGTFTCPFAGVGFDGALGYLLLSVEGVTEVSSLLLHPEIVRKNNTVKKIFLKL